MATRKWQQTRDRGHPTDPIGFRCPTELVKAIDAIADGDRSRGLIQLLDVATDVRKELGKLWVEVEAYARTEGISEGEALGRLVKEVLTTRGRK
jgi:hypothetical protein